MSRHQFRAMLLGQNSDLTLATLSAPLLPADQVAHFPYLNRATEADYLYTELVLVSDGSAQQRFEFRQPLAPSYAAWIHRDRRPLQPGGSRMVAALRRLRHSRNPAVFSGADGVG